MTWFIGALLLCSCDPTRNSTCPSLKIVSRDDVAFRNFMNEHKYISGHYEQDKNIESAKVNYLKKINHETALNQAETASISLIKSYRDPFKKWYYVQVSVATKDGFTVTYSESMEPPEYDYFCASGTFVISNRWVGKTMSVEPAR